MTPSLEERAKAFAVAAHGDQKYGGDRPYAYHLGKVNEVLRRFGVTDEALLAAAWLHDTVEDTQTGVDAVRAEFGARVAELVFAVTSEPGPNRKARHVKTYPKIRATPGAVTLKLADRIANVEECMRQQAATGTSPQLGMYRGEHAGFREALHEAGVADALWAHLDGLLDASPPPSA